MIFQLDTVDVLNSLLSTKTVRKFITRAFSEKMTYKEEKGNSGKLTDSL